jgi:hypothetical protein
MVTTASVENHPRLTFMMLDQDIVVSPLTVSRC